MNANRRHFLLFLAASTAAGLVLRASGLGLAAFNSDEALLSIFASQVAFGKAFPTNGILTSFGFHNPPLLTYLVAPFFRITRDPRLAMLGFAIAGAAAIPLTACAARRLWGDRAGLAAAALTAFLPLAVEHCRRLWGHDTLIFWSALCLYASVRGIEPAAPSERPKARWNWMILSMAGAAAAQACHLSGALLWILPVGALLLFRPRRWGLLLGAGLLVLLLVYLPWLLNDGLRNGFSELRLILKLAAGQAPGPSHPSPFPASLCWATLLSDSWQNNQIGFAYEAFLENRPWLAVWLFCARGLGIALMLGGVGALLFEGMRKKRAAPAAAGWAFLIAAAALAPGILFTVLRLTTVAAYQLPALIPAILAASFFLSRIGDLAESAVFTPRSNTPPARIPRGASGNLAMTALLAFFITFGAAYTMEARRALARSSFEDRVTPTLSHWSAAVSYILNTAEGRSYAIMQGARTPEEGIDYSVLYVHYWLTGDPTNPSWRDSHPPRVLFVIRANRPDLPGPAKQWLADRPAHRFGPLEVYRLEGHDALFWREQVGRISEPGS
jgi:4-amino-4-deoxy-L-arabinose transferase-like glycosyltransferase